MATRISDLPEISAARVLELKREAKETAPHSRRTHAQVLHTIAQREGFPSWEALVVKAGGADTIRAAKRALQ